MDTGTIGGRRPSVPRVDAQGGTGCRSRPQRGATSYRMGVTEHAQREFRKMRPLATIHGEPAARLLSRSAACTMADPGTLAMTPRVFSCDRALRPKLERR
jgi:hypothetical protein